MAFTAPKNYITGYIDIFSPPYSIGQDIYRGAMYAIASAHKTKLVLIPLVPDFSRDVVRLVQCINFKSVDIIALDMGLPFISDYYLSWYYLTKDFKIPCDIYSKYLPNCKMPPEFEEAIKRSKSSAFSFNFENDSEPLNTETIQIQISTASPSSEAPLVCDAYIETPNGRTYFVQEMDNRKARILAENKDKYDTIHMPFISGNYGGMSRLETLHAYPQLADKIVANQFHSIEEYEYARSQGVRVGGLINHDLIQEIHAKQ